MMDSSNCRVGSIVSNLYVCILGCSCWNVILHTSLFFRESPHLRQGHAEILFKIEQKKGFDIGERYKKRFKGSVPDCT